MALSYQINLMQASASFSDLFLLKVASSNFGGLSPKITALPMIYKRKVK